MFCLIIGDTGSFSLWSYHENLTMAILLVIYLMNLFIGLLSNAIEGYNKYEEFLLLKAQVIFKLLDYFYFKLKF